MAEDTPLLAPDGEDMFSRPNGKLLSPQKPGGGGMGMIDLVVAIFLPWLMFTLVVCCFIYFYHDYRWLVWSIVGASVLLGMLMVAMGAGRSRSVHLAVGLLCLTATCVGTSLGVYLYDTYASTYWQLEDGAEYQQVSPSSNGSNYADATTLSFSPDAFVDNTRTLGYMEAGVVYCVAPVTSQKFSSAPQYWAAGKDCCDQRANFRCGDAANPLAKSGVAIQDDDLLAKYKTAIRMAEAVYQLDPTATGRVALSWTASAGSSLKEDLWASCLNLLFLSSGMYLVCSAAAALLLRKSVQRVF